MSANTKIEWCDHTFNPWIGCTKVSPACDHCYAAVSTPARTLAIQWGAGQERRRTTPSNWAMPKRWQAQAEAFQAQHGRRQRVFCASLADVFDNAVDPQWRADLFELIESTPGLDWLLLTKRVGNVRGMVPAPWVSQPFQHGPDPTNIYPAGWPAHVWLGATICNQDEADRDVPKLLAVPACVRFLSIEPLLGAVDLALCDCDKGSRQGPGGAGGVTCSRCSGAGGRMVDWVIVGGESGNLARPMHPDWARSLRDQCASAGVPFLFKQWGEWTPGENVERQRGTVDTALLLDDEWIIRPLNLTTDHGHIDDQPDLYRVGKKAAGRLLDGVTHDGFPGSAA